VVHVSGAEGKKGAGLMALANVPSPWIIPDPSDKTTSARRQRYEILAEWVLASSRDRAALGMPDSQQALADLLGVSGAAVSQWKKSAEFTRIMGAHLRSHFGAERLAHVIDNMYRIATGDTGQSVPAARTLLDYMAKSSEKVGLEDELEDLTDEELETLYQAMLRRKAEQPDPSKGATMVGTQPSPKVRV
jgi:hypothetical protein